MKQHFSRLRVGFTLVELMIVVSIIGLLLAIAVPNFLKARENSRARACVANLRQIDTAKQQYMLDKNTSAFTSANSSDPSLGTLVPLYVRSIPTCPLNGSYTTGDGTTSPTCSLSTSDAPNYGSGGQYPHYLP